MPYKIGGGNVQELYNENNGQYCRNPKCEEDEKHLIFSKLFGIDANIPIQFPMFGIHDEDYCKLFITYCLNTKYPFIAKEKVTKYLLSFKEKNDKSSFFKKLGYTIDNSDELYNQIICGTSFKNKKLKRFDQLVLSFNTETRILNKNSGKYYFCTSSWAIEKDYTVRFITLIPEVFKNE